ncbi:MAG: hypothetical protein MHM6MM_001379 [Cercozoa sp. M6MM]
MHKLRRFAKQHSFRDTDERLEFVDALARLHKTNNDGVERNIFDLVELRCALLYTARCANVPDYATVKFQSLLKTHAEELCQHAPTLWKLVISLPSADEPLPTEEILAELEVLGQKSQNAEMRRACDFSDELLPEGTPEQTPLQVRKKRVLVRGDDEPAAKRSRTSAQQVKEERNVEEPEQLTDAASFDKPDHSEEPEDEPEGASDGFDGFDDVFPESDSEKDHNNNDNNDNNDSNNNAKKKKKKLKKEYKTEHETEELNEQQKLHKYEEWLYKARRRRKKLAQVPGMNRTVLDPKLRKKLLDAVHAMFLEGSASQERVVWSRLTRVLYDRGELTLAERVCLPKRKNGRDMLRAACTSPQLAGLRASYPAAFRAFLDSFAKKASAAAKAKSSEWRDVRSSDLKSPDNKMS